DRTKFLPYVAPSGETMPTMRALRSRRMVAEDANITYERLIAKKHSTRMELADKVLPDLLKAANGATEAARVLDKWDRPTDVQTRRGALSSGTGTPMSTVAAPCCSRCLRTDIFRRRAEASRRSCG